MMETMTNLELRCSLQRFANLLTHPQFLALFISNESRFEHSLEVTDVIHEKLRSDLLFQLKQYANYECQDITFIPEVMDNDSLKALFGSVAKSVKEKAGSICAYDNKYASRFTVPRSESLLSESRRELFRTDNLAAACNTINALSSPMSPRFISGGKLNYLTDIFSATHALIESKDTLCNHTGSAFYESALDWAIGQGSDYWQSGFPSDLLAYDKILCQSDTVYMIGLRKNFISSFAASENNRIPLKAVKRHSDVIFSRPEKMRNSKAA
jgi:hypothetical protein